jgi:ABC-2 type transport system ATP-binding protein
MTLGQAAIPALEATGLVYAYKQNRAVDGVDLLVETGSVYGLLDVADRLTAADLPGQSADVRGGRAALAAHRHLDRPSAGQGRIQAT